MQLLDLGFRRGGIGPVLMSGKTHDFIASIIKFDKASGRRGFVNHLEVGWKKLWKKEPHLNETSVSASSATVQDAKHRQESATDNVLARQF